MFNRTPHLSDFASDPELGQIAVDLLHASEGEWAGVNRKWWEWAMVMRAAEQHRLLDGSAVALGIAVGNEQLLYALANHCRLVIGTDLYGATVFATREADEAMLRDPAQFARFRYDHNGLVVASMDACDLAFADNTFDLLFSCSSVEHFGPDERVLQAMREARRVLRPGGVYALSVDYMFRCSTPPRAWHIRRSHMSFRDERQPPLCEFLTATEVTELLVDRPGFELAEPIDFSVDEAEIVNVFDLVTLQPESGEFTPHLWLRHKDSFLTSLFLVLHKPS